MSNYADTTPESIANLEKSPLLSEVTYHNSERHYGWSFRCPGCKHPHTFDERWKATCNDPLKPSFEPSLINTHRNAADDGDFVCHLHLLSGVIHFLEDCSHELRGQKVPCPPWEKG